MAVGALSAVGGAKETVWGTGVVPTFFVPFSSEGFKDGPEAITELQVRGILDIDPKYKGMNMVSGSLAGIVYPSQFGNLLRAALGPPVTTGVGPYVHTFTPLQAAFSADAALPPYSFTVKRDATQTVRYEGCVCSKLGMKFAQGDKLTFDSSWMGKTTSIPANPTVTLPTDLPFTITAALTRNAVAFADVTDFSIEISNTLEAVKLINNTNQVGRIVWSGRRQISISLTADFATKQLYDDFVAFTALPWVFTLTVGTTSLVISVPALLITDAGAAVGGDGRVTISATAEGQYDIATARALQIVLNNAVASY